MSESSFRRPTFLGLGAPRCGTTWLFRCLQAHPDVFVPLRKEIQFFDHERIAGSFEKYLANFAEAEDETAVGEISTRYLSSERAPTRVREYLPGVRLFVSLRDPVDQVYSHYWHLRRQNFHLWERDRVPESFREAVGDFPAKLLDPARYATHIRRWLECFPRDRLHVVFFDDIKDRPGEVVRSLYAHIGVNENFRPPSLGEHDARSRRGVSPRATWAGQLHSILHDIANRHIYQPLKKLVGVQRAEWLKERVRIRELLEGLFFQPGYPEMASEDRELLRKHFRDEIQDLEELVDRELSAWQ